MKRINILIFLVTLFSSHSVAQNSESIIKQFKASINNIDSENINDVYIANSVSIINDKGQENYYFDDKKVKGIYNILFETDNYLYISEIQIKNNIAVFYTQNNPLIRIEDNYFGGIAEELEISKDNEVIKTIVLYDDAKFDIDSQTITYTLNSQNKYTYSIYLKDSMVNKNNSLNINIKNSFSPFLKEQIQEVYISESCIRYHAEGFDKFPFKDNMKNGIFQVIFETENYFYVLKVREVSNSVFSIFTEIEPIKRISRNLLFDDTTENVFIDEYGRLLNTEVLFTDADSDLDDDIFELIEGTNKVTFKLINSHE